MQNGDKLKVLVLDEFKYMRSLVATMLDRAKGNTVTVTCDSIERAMDDLERFEPDVVITDWNPDFIRRVRDANSSANPYVPIIMLTGHAELALVTEARDMGVKSFSPSRSPPRRCTRASPRRFTTRARSSAPGPISAPTGAGRSWVRRM